jgi:RNA polymerase sigma-70 factor (ECF subfamily)
MTAPGSDSPETRASLLARLKDWDDHASWQEFHDTYRRLIHNFALKQGVAEDAAKDIVQETVMAVSSHTKRCHHSDRLVVSRHGCR